MSKQNRARTRTIRQRMSETGETYTQAARAVSGGADTPTGDGDRLGQILSMLLAEKRAEVAQDEAEATREERLGHRIVDGGPDSPASWSLIDWRTQQVIAQGDGGDRIYEQAMDRLDPDGNWVHIDVIRDRRIWGNTRPRKRLPGIVDSLVEALDDWIENPWTPPDQIAVMAGWTEQEVIDSLGER